MDKIKNGIEIALLLGFTLALYLLMAVTLPLFGDAHGLLVMTEWADISRGVTIHMLMAFSAVICALLGALLLEWIPSFTSSLMATLWSVTYFFIWIDGVFSLCLESQSLRYLYALGLGVVFIYLFFLLLHAFTQGQELRKSSEWQSKLAGHWFWAWMGFYFGLSCLMAYDSLWFLTVRWALAFGAMVLCFFNYLLCLFLKKTDGAAAGVGDFSLAGRRFFTAWFSVLVLLWVAERFFNL
ncbi:MAG: hypothetical protein ACREL1_02985 [bacterium]